MEEKKTFNRDTSLLLEIVRFAIIGLYATLIDYIAEVWMTSLIGSAADNVGHLAAFFIQFAVSLGGMLIGTPVTWSLSTVWAFRNVNEEDEKKARTLKGNLKFLMWGFFGLVGGAIIQFIGYMTCLEWTGWGVNIIKDINMGNLFSSGIKAFWCYTVVFVLKTGFTTIWNYVTRKLFIYRAPKKEEKSPENA